MIDVPATDPALLDRLHARLQRDAAADVRYRVVDSPVGPLLVAATDVGLVRVAFEREGEATVLQALADRVSSRILRSPAALDKPARWLDRYFAGATDPYPAALDLRLAHGFRRTVLDRLREVPYGQRVSYAALATAADHPKAVRATGTACATNPLPLVIPCHRVTRSDGSVGAYLGGPEVKVRLLAMEAGAPISGA